MERNGARMTTPSVPSTRWKGPERREAILVAATRLIVEGGFEAASTRRIAAAVGISQPSLYAHFPTQEALADALATRSFEELNRRLKRVAHAPIPQRFETLVRGYIDFALEEPGPYRIAFILDHPGPLPSVEDIVAKPGFEAFTIFATALGELQALGLLRPGPLDVLAQSVWASMHGLCALLLTRPTFPWVERQTLIDHHVALLCQGACPAAS